MATRIATFVAAVALSNASSAQGDASPRTSNGGFRTSAINWTRHAGAEGCASPRELALAVEARLGRSVFVSPAVADLQVDGHVEPDATGGFRAELRLGEAKGEPLGVRELHHAGTSCADMTGKLSLALALMIDPEAELGERSAAPAPAPAPAPPAIAPTVTASRDTRANAPANAAATATSRRFQLDGDFVLATLLLPHLATGMRAHALVDLPKWPILEVLGVHLPHVGSGDTSYTMSFAGAGICPVSEPTQLARLTFCIDVTAGGIEAVRQDSLRLEPVLHTWLRGDASRKIVGPLMGTMGVQLGASFLRAEFDYEVPYATPPIAAMLDLGLGIEVP